MFSLQAEHHPYTNLYVTCKSREGNLGNFFMHENHLYPPAISEHTNLRKCLSKSDFLVCINGYAEPKYALSVVEMEVIEGAMFVSMNSPAIFNAHGEYCDIKLKANILKIADALQQVDIVFDTY